MLKKEIETPDDTLSSTGPSHESSAKDPLGSTLPVISKEIPPGVDRRTFLMRSAVVGATVVITGCSMGADEQTQRATAPAVAPSPPLDPNLDVVKKGQGPVMTLLDEFYKVGPGPSSSHTIGPMRIT